MRSMYFSSRSLLHSPYTKLGDEPWLENHLLNEYGYQAILVGPVSELAILIQSPALDIVCARGG